METAPLKRLSVRFEASNEVSYELRAMNARFPKSEKLLKKKEFQGVFDEGRIFRNNELLVYALPNGMNKSRLGLVVGKKVGNAVRRNRVKRILREAFRLNKGLLRFGVDIVLIPRPGLTTPALSTIEDGFKRLLTRISAEFVGAGFKPAPTLRD